MGMQEVDEASTFIKEHGHKNAEIIWGAAINPDFEDQMMITVIATGFDENDEAAVSQEQRWPKRLARTHTSSKKTPARPDGCRGSHTAR